ncbi:FAD-binding molybdopterin dehydrogenase [Phragmitibacter flavus]|uniref:FAD-binding molybdopterin dehydrogenase n=1 Tax=Phragmitibacter flavus TaxID=2576071 RepID=A0A5R8KIT4_9BACT|nr:FAD binding domain-containing protein [Phragmitibacter flavus]TLD72160.1 FAD-binding molybdopterin dehydrogenase [Phragmitibacter flavus]
MDLNTVTSYHRPASPDQITSWQFGDSWLAGGTWLFSEPQVGITNLIDITAFDWPSLTITPAGLEIAATCKITDLETFTAPSHLHWQSLPLLGECARSLLASFKIKNEATVGGNLIMSLPAGAMISLTAALEAILTLHPRQGEPRQTSVIDFVTGNHQNTLQPGELLRSILIPDHALQKTYAFHRFSLSQEGRSSVLLIGTLCPNTGNFILTITAATPRPIQLTFDTIPDADAIKSTITTAIPDGQWFDDPHGTPDHRQHLTHYFAQQIREELSSI